MRAAWALVAVLALATPASALLEAPQPGHTDACAPPCGYITPQMDIRVEDKPTCAAGLGRAVDPSECIPMPGQGESVTYDGALVWEWDMSEDGTYPNDAQEDIQISFQGTASNPDWLSFTVEPATFTITTADLADPRNLQQRESEGSPAGSVWFHLSWPVTITITRDGEPTPEERSEIATKGDVVNLFVKAKSTESGDRFKPSWYVEKFALDGTGLSSADQESPGVPAVGVLAALGAGMVIARRRRGL